MKGPAPRLLIIKPSSLGDVVHTLPAAAAIRDGNPDAEITWLINREWAPLLRGNPDIDHVHIFPRGEFRGWRAPLRILPWLRRTRRLRPHLAFDFQGLLRTALIAKASGAKEIYGMSDGREGSRLFYHRVARVDRNEHAVDRYLKLAGLTGGTPLGSRRRFPIPTGDALPRFDPYPHFVVLHPYARGGRKSLSRAVIQEFCRALEGVRVIVVGKSHTRFPSRENCIDLTNQTSLLQLVWVLRNASFVISADSGPMHIAAAVTSNLVSIHTWTDPRRVGPYNPAAWVWKSGRIAQICDLPEPGEWGKARRFRPEDVRRIADLARSALAQLPES